MKPKVTVIKPLCVDTAIAYHSFGDVTRFVCSKKKKLNIFVLNWPFCSGRRKCNLHWKFCFKNIYNI